MTSLILGVVLVVGMWLGWRGRSGKAPVPTRDYAGPLMEPTRVASKRFCAERIARLELSLAQPGREFGPYNASIDELLAAQRRHEMRAVGIHIEHDLNASQLEDLVPYYERRHPGSGLGELFRATLCQDGRAKYQAHEIFIQRLRELEEQVRSAAR